MHYLKLVYYALPEAGVYTLPEAGVYAITCSWSEIWNLLSSLSPLGSLRLMRTTVAGSTELAGSGGSLSLLRLTSLANSCITSSLHHTTHTFHA